MKRPLLTDIESAEEFRKWYWLKEELVAYCKSVGISYVGGKFEIQDRIVHLLEYGHISRPISKPKIAVVSKFDWSKEILSLDTVITDSYKNSQNVRLFFEKQVGHQFHFSIDLMKFMKSNSGKMLKDAVAEWHRLHDLKKDKNYKTEIPSHNQYNQYMRSFLADNPDKTRADAMKYWKLKKALPDGAKYEKSDLDLIS